MSAIGTLKHTCQLLHVSANRIFREPIPVGLIMRVGPAWPALVVRARRFVGLVEQPVGNQCCCVTEGRRSAGILPAGQRAQALMTTKRSTAQTVGTQVCSRTSQIIRHGQLSTITAV